jgi:hypothetical protein
MLYRSNEVGWRKKSGDRCYGFKIISPKNLAKKWAFFAPSTAGFRKKMITKLVLIKTPIFCRK